MGLVLVYRTSKVIDFAHGEIGVGLSHRIVAMDFGRKVTEGVPEEVKRNAQVVES